MKTTRLSPNPLSGTNTRYVVEEVKDGVCKHEPLHEEHVTSVDHFKVGVSNGGRRRRSQSVVVLRQKHLKLRRIYSSRLAMEDRTSSGLWRRDVLAERNQWADWWMETSLAEIWQYIDPWRSSLFGWTSCIYNYSSAPPQGEEPVVEFRKPCSEHWIDIVVNQWW